MTWTADDLERIGAAAELQISPRSPDGTYGRFTPIWVVRVGDELYVRSWRGTRGGWFRAAQATHAARVRAGGLERDVTVVEADAEVNEAVDAAYRTKYGSYGAGYVGPMTKPPARDTTLRLVPHADGEQNG